MAQIPNIKDNLQVNTDSWNSVADAIDYAGGDSDDYVTTYGDKIKKIVDNKNAKIDMIEAENKDLKLENNELDSTIEEYESNFLDINNAILSKGSSPAGGYDTYAEAILEIGGGEVTINLQSKEVSPTVDGETVTPDAGYNGLSAVVVKPIELEERHIAPALVEKEIVPSVGKIGLSKVTVGAVTSDIDENIKPENIVDGVEILGVIGSHICESGGADEPVLVALEVEPTDEVQVFTPEDGVDGFNIVTVGAIPEGGGSGTDLVLSPLLVVPTTEIQEFTPEEGVDGFSPVTVSGVDSSIDNNIQPNNIRDGVTILGVAGTYAGTGDAPDITNARYLCYEECRDADVFIPLIKNCTSFEQAFRGCNLKADTYDFDLSKATSWNEWLYNAGRKSSGGTTTFNFTVGTSIKSLLQYLSNTGANADSRINIKFNKPAGVKLTDASEVFYRANNIQNIDFGNIFDDVENLKCYALFYDINNNKDYGLQIDLSSLDFSKINNAQSMFRSNKINKVVAGDVTLSGIDCAYFMGNFEGEFKCDSLSFNNCTINNAFENYAGSDLTLDIIQTSTNGGNSYRIFNNAKLNNISSTKPWEFYKNTDYAFYGCNNLKTVPVIKKHIVASNNDNIANMYENCSSLEEITLEIIYDNPSSYWRLYCDNLFSGCSKLKKITGLDLSGQYAQYNNIFKNCSSLEELYVTGTLAGYNTNSSMTWDLSASAVFKPISLLSSVERTPDGKTRIIKLNSSVYSKLTEEEIALASSKNITLASA